MRRDHINSILPQLFIQLVAVTGAVTNQVVRIRLDHVEVETQLYQGDFMMIRRMRAARQRQPVTVDNRHAFHTLF